MSTKNKFKSSFFKKLLISFMVISIGSVLTLGTLTYMISTSVSMNNLERQVTDTVEKATSSLQRTIGEYKTAISYFSIDKEMIDVILKDEVSEDSRSSVYQKMFIMLAGKPTAAAMHLIKADGSFSLSTSTVPKQYSIKNHKDWGVYRQLSHTDTSVVYSNRFTAQNGITYSTTIAHNIKHNGKIIGYVIIDISADVFRTALDSVNSSLPIKFLVMDQNNYVLYDEIYGRPSQIFLDDEMRKQMGQSTQFYLNDPKQLFTWSKTAPDKQFVILSSVPVQLVVMNSNYITVTTLAVAIGEILLCLILLPLIIHRLTKPLNTIVLTMNQVKNGNTKARVAVKNEDEFGFIGTNLNSMLDNLNELYQTNLEKQNRLRLAELKSLHSQINPHFLYNTLDSIKWLAKLNGVNDIVVIVSQLGRLLKNSIHNQKDSVQISEELALVESYLAIQKVRYSDKFDVDVEVDESIQECIVPKLIIQPIVENAIIHGIEDKIGKAHLTIKGRKEDHNIIFEIIDDGMGISNEQLQKINSKMHNEDMGNNSIGLANVDKRIKLYYGEQYGLTITSEVNEGTITKITMPFQEPTNTQEESELKQND